MTLVSYHIYKTRYKKEAEKIESIPSVLNIISPLVNIIVIVYVSNAVTQNNYLYNTDVVKHFWQNNSITVFHKRPLNYNKQKHCGWR